MRTQKACKAINKAENWLLVELKSNRLGIPYPEETISYFASRKKFICDSEAIIFRWKNEILTGIRYNNNVNMEVKQIVGISSKWFHEITNISFESLFTVKDLSGSFLFDFIELPDFTENTLGPIIGSTE